MSRAFASAAEIPWQWRLNGYKGNFDVSGIVIMAMTGQEHARLLGLLFLLYTAFQVVILIGFGIFFMIFFGAIFTQIPSRPGEPPPEIMLPFIFIVLAISIGFSLLLCIPEVVAGYGLRRGKPWARLWSIIACVLAVMSFPIGTALGVYGLVFLFGDQGKQYFESVEFASLSSKAQRVIPPPPPNSWQ